jgi:hypothetical protein
MQAAVALAFVAAFGIAAIIMLRTAFRDWRAARAAGDRTLTWFALQTFWPGIIAGSVALAVPVWVVAS